MDQKTQNAIISSVDQEFDQQIELTKTLVRFDSLRGNEGPLQKWMADYIAGKGYEVDHWKLDHETLRHHPGYSPTRFDYSNTWNTAGVLRARGGGAGRSLVLNGHIDVVATGDHSQWLTPPFEPQIRDGWLYGRGAGDMKSGLAAAISAVEAIRNAGFEPDADIVLQSVAEEEYGGNGALACLVRGYRADAVLIPEPFGPKVMRAQMGVLWFKVEIEGDPQHASADFSGGGANAFDKMLLIVEAVRELAAEWASESTASEHYSNVVDPPRLNIGQISGGLGHSIVMPHCSCTFRMGFYPHWSREDAEKRVRGAIQQVQRNDPYLSKVPPKLTFDGMYAEGYALPPGSEAEVVLSKAHQTVFKAELEEYVTTALTDARFTGLYANIPSLVYGPVCLRPHGYDEAVEVESLRSVTKSIALFIAEWCGLNKRTK